MKKYFFGLLIVTVATFAASKPAAADMGKPGSLRKCHGYTCTPANGLSNIAVSDGTTQIRDCVSNYGTICCQTGVKCGEIYSYPTAADCTAGTNQIPGYEDYNVGHTWGEKPPGGTCTGVTPGTP